MLKQTCERPWPKEVDRPIPDYLGQDAGAELDASRSAGTRR